MNPELIKTFLSLAETRNFNRTAEMLYVSQPTVTARIMKL
ncbi:MAG: LysR family transcriptional regulator, partial [Clostridia bacterium]|nr:LysR family transcriptional regulator [Clostridia bacterium]